MSGVFRCFFGNSSGCDQLSCEFECFVGFLDKCYGLECGETITGNIGIAGTGFVDRELLGQDAG